MLPLTGRVVLVFGASGTAVGFNVDMKDWLLQSRGPAFNVPHSRLWILIPLHLTRIRDREQKEKLLYRNPQVTPSHNTVP